MNCGNISERKRNSNRENLKKAVLARQNGAWVEKYCLCCGKLCTVRRCQVKKGWKYCSWECRIKGMVGDNGSNAGGGAWMLGKKNINYRHGKSSETVKRDLTKVNRWRRRVFQRDKHICQHCGYNKGKILRAHHIRPWALFPEYRYVLKNGITLCNPCHKWVHSKKNKTGEYLICS